MMGITLLILAVFKIRQKKVFIIGMLMTISGIILIPLAYIQTKIWIYVFSIFVCIIGILKIIMVVKKWAERKKYFLFSGIIYTLTGVITIFLKDPIFLRILLGLTISIMGFELIRMGLIPTKIPFKIQKLRKKYNKNYFSFNFKKRIPGEAYGVYLGGGYHTGIYVGKNKIVHFLREGKIFLHSWEHFCLNRPARLMKYPDLQDNTNKKIVKYALSQVGKKYVYDGINYNCETFVIKCLTLGKTTNSMFAQTSSALSIMNTSPYLGLIIELVSRPFERRLFTKGGKNQKKFALRLRSIRSMVTRTILYKNMLENKLN